MILSNGLFGPQGHSRRLHLVFRNMSDPDVRTAELGKRKRGPPPKPFSAWQPGDASMQGQRKKKQRENEERIKERERVAKFRQLKKETDGGTEDKN